LNRTTSPSQFLPALINAFRQKKVTVQVKEQIHEANSCDISLQLTIPFTNITTELSLELTRVSDDSIERVTSVFLLPLFEYFSRRTGTDQAARLEQEIAQLEKEIADIESGKVVFEEESQTIQPQSPVRTEPNVDFQPEQNTITATEGTEVSKEETSIEKAVVPIPAATISKFLSDIKEKLLSNNNLTIIEQKSFDNILNLLQNPETYDKELANTISDSDYETLSWLKTKFAGDYPRIESDVITLVSAEEWASKATIPVPLRDEILEMYDRVDDWNFDVFTIDKLTNGHVLFATSYSIMIKYDFLKKFNIPEQTLINLFREIESGYHPNPYHNALHAAAVLQVVHYTIAKGGLGQHLSDEEKFAVLFSAIIHDFDHPGLNNAFLMNSRSYLSTLYNDRSVLENHHAAQSFDVMKNSNFNIFKDMDITRRKILRDLIVDIVLATDMGRHTKICNKFKSRVEKGVDWKSKADIMLVLQLTLKVADVNNLSRPTYLYLRWTERIIEEFYAQGDKEKLYTIPVTPMMDRLTANLGKCQTAFANFVVVPMFTTFGTLLPQMAFTLNYVQDQKKYWEEHEEIDAEWLAPRENSRRYELE
jgi:hypothetical protein